MKILIAGGSGFVGRNLTRLSLEQGHQVTAIGGHPHADLSQQANFRYIAANTSQPGDWQQEVSSHDVLINLTGCSVLHFWSASYKEALYNSRILTTRHLINALPDDSGGKVVLSASAAGYYGDSGEAEVTEESEPGQDFLARVCIDWEREAAMGRRKNARVAMMRFGVILGREGGALQSMITPFKFGLGGPIGTGRQWFPWIHIDDVCKAIFFLMANSDASGPFNFTAPHSVRQKEFALNLGRALRRPAFMPAPAFLLKLVLGEFGESLLQGQKARPARLLAAGYQFRFPELAAAFSDVV